MRDLAAYLTELAAEDGTDIKIVAQEEISGGHFIRYQADGDPFPAERLDGHFLGHWDGQGHFVHWLTAKVDGHHLIALDEHDAQPEGIEAPDRHSGSLWIGENEPTDEVNSRLKARHHELLVDAAASFLSSAARLLDDLPAGTEMPSYARRHITKINRSICS